MSSLTNHCIFLSKRLRETHAAPWQPDAGFKQPLSFREKYELLRRFMNYDSSQGVTQLCGRRAPAPAGPRPERRSGLYLYSASADSAPRQIKTVGDFDMC